MWWTLLLYLFEDSDHLIRENLKSNHERLKSCEWRGTNLLQPDTCKYLGFDLNRKLLDNSFQICYKNILTFKRKEINAKFWCFFQSQVPKNLKYWWFSLLSEIKILWCFMTMQSNNVVPCTYYVMLILRLQSRTFAPIVIAHSEWSFVRTFL